MSESANSLLSWDAELSPFASLLGTNHIPTTAELASLKALLVHPEHELSRLEAEIDRVQALLSSLRSEKQKILDYVEAHRALASPVRQIPPETLAEIFIHCLPTDLSYGVRDLTQAPLILTTICRDWRRVAITTPRLWNSLHIYLPLRLSHDACLLRIAGIKLWLSRSSSIPLSLSFHSTKVDRPRGLSNGNIINLAILQSNLEMMIRSLMEHSDRFRDLFLSLSPSTFTTFDKLSPSLFPALVSFRVKNGDGATTPRNSRSSPLPQLAPLLSRMPVLRNLEASLFAHGDSDYHSLPCNWKNLTKLVIDDPLSPVQALAILAETPRIKSVSFLLSIGLSTVDNTATTIHLRDLTEMELVIPDRLWGNDPDIFDIILHSRVTFFVGCIQCPALRLFSFICNWIRMTIPKLPSAGLPLQSLETLKLDLPLTPGALTECLSQTPNLINFEFKTSSPNFPFQDSHFSCLTPSLHNPAPLWPNLKVIRIFHLSAPVVGMAQPSMSFTNAALTSFLESRSRTLKYCDVFYHAEPQPFFSDVELHALKKIKRDGMRLRLHHQVQIPYIYLDSPDTGIGHEVPLYMVSSMQHGRDEATSDMESKEGTVIIV